MENTEDVIFITGSNGLLGSNIVNILAPYNFNIALPITDNQFFCIESFVFCNDKQVIQK